MAEWTRVVNTIIKDYIRGAEDDLMANRKLLKMLKSKGRIEYNKGGTAFEWKVPVRRATVTVNNGSQPITPSAVDRFRSASLSYEGYVVSDMMTEREKLMGQNSKEAIVDVFKNMSKWLSDDMKAKFSEELYVDGSASGNTGRISGIETFMAYTQTVNISTGAARSANAADVVAYPNDTYAGISTVLGSVSGSWYTSGGISSTWPAGRGDEGYDFFSPTITNYTSTAFGGSSATWAVQCETATRYMLDHLRRYVADNEVDMILLDRDLYRQFKEKQAAKERVIVEGQLGLRALGFKDTIEFEGTEITSEFGMPASVGYAFNINNMTLRSMTDTLFRVRGPKLWDHLNAYVTWVDCLGQLKFQSPRFFGKLAAIA